MAARRFRITRTRGTLPPSSCPPPERITLPMQQHIGAPCIPTVKKGDHVYVGQVVGDSDAYVCAPVHSSISAL